MEDSMIFGKVPLNPADIVIFLRDHVEKKVADRMKENHMKEVEAWTQGIKDTLAELVDLHGGPHAVSLFTSAVSPSADGMHLPKSRVPKRREFLLDFVWWEGEETKTSGRAVMGVECEWASWGRTKEQKGNEITYDFEKLLSFKAPLKLLIFESKDTQTQGYLLNRFRVYLSTFTQHVKGECYLFIDFSRGQCAAFTYEVQQDGAVSHVSLEPLTLKANSHRAGL
jgi:hypothetical protein